MYTPENDNPARTKEALERHNPQSFFKRLGNRVIGNRPSTYEREALRRLKIGTSGRVIEDVREAIRFTKKLNRTGRAVIYGGWITASLTGSEVSATLPTLITKAENSEAIKQLFKIGGHRSSAETMDAVGFIMDDYSSFINPSDVDHLTLVAMEDFNYLDSITLTKEQMDSLSTDEAKTLESVANRVLDHSHMEWLINKPDDV